MTVLVKPTELYITKSKHYCMQYFLKNQDIGGSQSGTQNMTNKSNCIKNVHKKT